MRLNPIRVAVHAALFLAATAVIVPPSLGQEESRGRDSDKVLSELRGAIERLEAKVDKLSRTPSEFIPVQVRVVDQDDRPLAGFKVELQSTDEAQRAYASDLSDTAGLSINRDLPYGNYRMTLRGGNWYTRGEMRVEIGKPAKLTVVAPSEDRHGDLVLRNNLDARSVEGLRFGERQLRYPGNSSWSTSRAPEPEEESDGSWEPMPTVGDGIRRVGVTARISVERRIAQPGGGSLTWYQYKSLVDVEPPLHWFADTGGALRPLVQSDIKHVEARPDSKWFSGATIPRGLSDRVQCRIGYWVLGLGDERGSRVSLRLPAGQVRVLVSTVYGEPTADVLSTLPIDPSSLSGEVWLPASIGNLGWLTRLAGGTIDEDAANPGGRRYSDCLEGLVDLEPGGRAEFEIRSER